MFPVSTLAAPAAEFRISGLIDSYLFRSIVGLPGGRRQTDVLSHIPTDGDYGVRLERRYLASEVAQI